MSDQLITLYENICCLYARNYKGSPHCVMAEVLDCGLKVSNFELQLSYYIQTNNLGKGMNPLISPPTNCFGMK